MSVFSHWLQAHPNKAAIRTLNFSSSKSATLQLPLHQLSGLRSLKALNSSIVAGPSLASTSHGQLSDSAVSGDLVAAGGPIAQLSALTCLHAQTTASLTAGLAALTQLQELACGMVDSGGKLSLKEGVWEWKSKHVAQIEADAAAVLGQLADALPALQALTSLELPPRHMLMGDSLDPVIQQVSCLTRLQRLTVTGIWDYGPNTDSCAVGWLTSAVLPPSLTALSIVTRGGDDPVSASYMKLGPSTPCLCKLAQSGNLQDLEVKGCTLDTGLLGSLTSLTRLNVRFTRLASAPGVPELLALSRLTALQCLELQVVKCQRREAGWASEQEAAADSGVILAAQAAAMTASTRLARLSLYDVSTPVVRHLFSSGQLCLNLRGLDLHRLLQCADVSRQMVSCCPNLIALALDQRYAPYAGTTCPDHLQLVGSLRCLTRLSQLRYLWLCFDSFEPDSSDASPDSGVQHKFFDALGALCLNLPKFNRLHLVGTGLRSEVLGLARCQQLMSLVLEPRPSWEVKNGKKETCTFTNKAPSGWAPDVWRQLLQSLMVQAAAKAGMAEGSPQEVITEMLDGATSPTTTVMDVSRAFVADPHAATADHLVVKSFFRAA